MVDRGSMLSANQLHCIGVPKMEMIKCRVMTLYVVVGDRSTKHAALPLHGGLFAGTIIAVP